jgi:hypothetical protein
MHLPRSHPAVIEFEDGSYGVKDELDSDVGTVHFVVRNPNDGNVIASIRTVDANTSKLDMEKVRKGETEKRGVGRAKREAQNLPNPLLTTTTRYAHCSSGGTTYPTRSRVRAPLSGAASVLPQMLGGPPPPQCCTSRA